MVTKVCHLRFSFSEYDFGITNANTWSVTEGNVGVIPYFRFVVFTEAVRIEVLRIRKIFRISV